MIILGVDPGLQKTGWGVIRKDGSHLSYIACGTFNSDPKAPLAVRLHQLHDKLRDVMDAHHPDQAAIEETFVNVNPASTLKLGQARGALLMTLSLTGIDVHEYSATQIKKTVVGVGRADKSQVKMMVEMLLPASKGEQKGPDATDALAVAICHAHHAVMKQKLS